MKSKIEDGMGCAGLLPSASEKAQEKERERMNLAYERLANGIAQAVALLETQAYQPTPNLMTIRAVLNILKSL